MRLSVSNSVVFLRWNRTDSALLVQIRWKIVLPVLMTILSMCLMVLEQRQAWMLRKTGTGWETPARVLDSLVNGPGFWLGGLLAIPLPNVLHTHLGGDASRLGEIALFWFLVGLSIDRRRKGDALDQHYPVRAGILFTFLALLCGLTGSERTLTGLCPGFPVGGDGELSGG
jgi:hypothetical protein